MIRNDKYIVGISNLVLDVRNLVERFINSIILYNSKLFRISIYVLFGYYTLSHRIDNIKYILTLMYSDHKGHTFKSYHYA
mgnify:CR=1 FL=1